MKFLLLLFAGLFFITNGLEAKDETIQFLMKMVYELKGEVEHLRLQMEGYSEPCNCTRLENLISNNTIKISKEIGNVQHKIQDLTSVVDSNAANITIFKEKVSLIEEASQNNSKLIETIGKVLSNNAQHIEENSDVIAYLESQIGKVDELNQTVKNNRDDIDKNAEDISANADRITINKGTSATNLERIDVIESSVSSNTQRIEENSEMGAILEVNLNSIKIDVQSNQDNVEVIESDVNGLTSRIIQLENQTKVAFSAFGSSSDVGDCDLTFDVFELNVGNALDLTTGVFKATVPGSYHFTISAQFFIASSILVRVMKNGEDYILIGMDYSWAMYLKEGDEISLQLQGLGGELSAYGDSNDPNFYIIFTGFLI